MKIAFLANSAETEVDEYATTRLAKAAALMVRPASRDYFSDLSPAGWLALRCPRWAAKNSAQEDHLGVLLQQRATLAFSHTTPDTELHLVVECLGGALGDDRTVPANYRRFSLRRSANEQSVGVFGCCVSSVF